MDITIVKIRLLGKEYVDYPPANVDTILRLSSSSPSPCCSASTKHHHHPAVPLHPSPVAPDSSTLPHPHESSIQDDQDSTKILRLFGKDIKPKSDDTMRRSSSPSSNGLTTHHHPYLVYDVEPLRCVPPLPVVGPNSSTLPHQSPRSTDQDNQDSRKRKRKDEENVGVALGGGGHKEKKKRKPYERKKPYVKRTKQDKNEKVPPPLIPPGLLERMQSRQGAPQFLCQKKLFMSDVHKQQNRLFIDKAGKIKVTRFLGRDELDDEGGVKGIFKAVDGEGMEYNLGLTTWTTVESQLVINKDWHKLIVANHAEEGDQVQIWGWKNEMDKTFLAINFITSLELELKL